MPVSSAYRASTSHASLGSDFFDEVAAAHFPQHILRYRNQRAAKSVGLDTLTDEEWIAHFGRFEQLPGTLEKPLALRYHGHQFRSYNPEIGDGRGFLFAQLHDSKNRLLDLATKGSGKTPWSRTADGKLTLKGGVREVLATSMLEALGVETSKSFSLIETGEALERGDEPSPTRSSVLVRLSHSHIRIGTFQRFAFLREPDNIRKLLDYTIRPYMPDAWRDEPSARAVAFLEDVCRRVARVGAQWMMAGFVHGVLNTDNMNITGESFDYGPYRFLPLSDPNFTAAYFDQNGLYAFGRQPEAVFWNLQQLAGCLTLVSETDPLVEALNGFGPAYRRELAAAMVARLGLVARNEAEDAALAQAAFRALAAGGERIRWEPFFFDWFCRRDGAGSLRAEVYAEAAFDDVRVLISAYAADQPERLDDPWFARPEPEELLIDEIEAIWAPIAEHDDWSRFHAKLAALEIARKAWALS